MYKVKGKVWEKWWSHGWEKYIQSHWLNGETQRASRTQTKHQRGTPGLTAGVRWTWSRTVCSSQRQVGPLMSCWNDFITIISSQPVIHRCNFHPLTRCPPLRRRCGPMYLSSWGHYKMCYEMFLIRVRCMCFTEAVGWNPVGWDVIEQGNWAWQSCCTIMSSHGWFRSLIKCEWCMHRASSASYPTQFSPW